MPYNLQAIQSTDFKGGKNILASEHLQFVEAGATIAQGAGNLQVGQAVARDKVAGTWNKYVDSQVANYDDFGILNVEASAFPGDNTIVGELIIRGSVYEAKCIGITDQFKAKTPMIRYVKNV